jgi:hypothetical protein
VAALLALSVAGALLVNRLTRESTVPEVAPSGTGTPTATPFSPHAVASPLPDGSGETLSAPQSAPAALGVVYSVRLLAPCVVLLDFDGSFWAARQGTTVYRPIQPGTVKLLPDRSALLRTAGGQDIDLRRIPAPVTVPVCG